MLYLLAGQMGPWVALCDARREAHEILRADRAADIAARKTRGTPLDDATNWDEIAPLGPALAAALGANDTVKVREIAATLQSSTRGALLPVPEYEEDHALDGIRIRLRVLSEAQKRVLDADVDAAIARRDVTMTMSTFIRTDEEAHAAIGTYVTAALVSIEGVSVVNDEGIEVPLATPLDERGVDVLRKAGVLGAVYAVAHAFQGLPAKKALRFGLPLPSTSASVSTAHSVQSGGASNSDASVEHPNHPSRALDTRQTDAPDDTSKITAATSPASSVSVVPSVSTSVLKHLTG